MTRRQALGLRLRAQQLGRDAGTLADTAVLDLGVQDTGTDGALWALAIRGVEQPPPEDLATGWTIRGAPHVYRRADLPGVAAATAPFSDADAGKRIYDASRPLKAGGITHLAAVDAVPDAARHPEPGGSGRRRGRDAPGRQRRHGKGGSVPPAHWVDLRAVPALLR